MVLGYSQPIMTIENKTVSPDHASVSCLLSPEACTFRIDETNIQFQNSISSDFAIIGQERAMMAIEMAINIRAKGYNLFVSGPAGTGKRTAIKHVLNKLPPEPERMRDLCLACDFKDPDAPRPLYFPAGIARMFQKDLRDFLRNLSAALLELSHQPQFRSIKDRILMQTETEEHQLIFDFEGKLSREGFKIVQLEGDEQAKTDILPLINDEVSDFDTLQGMVARGEMSETDYSKLRERQLGFIDEMQAIFETLRRRRKEMQHSLETLRSEIIQPFIHDGLETIALAYDSEEVKNFLKDMEEHLDSSGGLIKKGIESTSDSSGKAESNDNLDLPWSGSDVPEHLKLYDVNVLIDHSDDPSNPILFEQYPDYPKLFGIIEPSAEGSDARASHHLVRAGSLLKASGGYLVLRAEDLLRDEDTYVALKRALQEGSVEIRNVPNSYGQGNPSAVKPKPIKIDLKLIVMAPDGLYEALFDRDEDFEKLFKVPAEFDSSVDRTAAVSQTYTDFLYMIAQENKLLTLTKSAVAALHECAVRDSEFRNKLSTRFSSLADILREGNYHAIKTGAKEIHREHIESALRIREFLYNLPEEKIDEQILSGELLIHVEGSQVGRVNGLAVMDRGYYAFGRPTVISAQVAPGSDGVINVEREVGLSGEIHDKGTMIVESYIKAIYAKDFPLSISASICFEQSYSEVDGDSASSTEVYALLSSIGNIPLRQDIAVTGSVNQMGQIQPVGGVVQKIEGFYAVCKKVGLNGKQGVIIPHQNIENLILREDVQHAIQTGQFRVWAIKTIDEGFEILSQLTVGRKNAKGVYQSDSFNAIIEKRLREMARISKEFGN